MPIHTTPKPENVDYCHVPCPLWRCVTGWLPRPVVSKQGGRPRADERTVLNGIWYVLWTGSPWKAVQIGVCRSTLHERVQGWRQAGVFSKVMRVMVRLYARQRGIQWEWQAIDSKACPGPLGGDDTGHSPVDRHKRGSKLHLLVDQRGVPLAVLVSAASVHDKWSVDDLILACVITRPNRHLVEQHLCVDAGYDYPEVHDFVEHEHYLPHIKRRRRRNDPPRQPTAASSETQFPARRWVAERTFSWLTKRRSIHTRWCKKPPLG